MELADYVVQVVSNPCITSLVQVQLAAYFARHADPQTDYTIYDADPRLIAGELGYAQAPVYKAMAALHNHGLIEWRRAPGQKGGSVRILLPSQS